jgi:HlyD family secretion protein
MPFSGRLLRHPWEEGDEIEKGQVLARMQANLPRAALEASEAQLEATRRELDLVNNLEEERAAVQLASAGLAASRSREAAHKSQLPIHQANLDLARLELKRISELSQKGAATNSQLDRARNELQRQEGTLAVARSEQTAAAAETRAAQATLDRARAALQDQRTRAASLGEKVRGQQASLLPLRDNLGRIELRCPSGGKILAVLQRSEAVLPAGTPLFEIGDPDSLEVEADLLSEDSTSLAPEGLFSISLQGRETQEIPVKLRGISPRGFTKRSALGVEEQRVHAWFSFLVPPKKLGHGYRVYLRAATRVIRGAILVPRRALVRRGNGWSCFLSGPTARMRTVTLGPGDASWVSVLSGLVEGDEVLLDVPEDLLDGDPLVRSPALDLAPPAPLPGGAAG